MNLFTCAKRSLKIEESECFLQTYRRFMREYDKGGDPEYIKDLILYDFHKHAGDSEYFLHDVYFALARAMWEIGGLPDDLLRVTGDIIRSGCDLEYFRMKSFPEEAIETRKRKLNDFLCRLMLPNKHPRGRIPRETDELPLYRVGDVFSYSDDGRRRLLVIADSVDRLDIAPAYFCCVPERYYDEDLPCADSLMEERLGMLGLFVPSTMIEPEELTYVMHLDIPCGKYPELFGSDPLFRGISDFYGELHIAHRCTLKGYAECKPGCAGEFLPVNLRHGDEAETVTGW